MSRLSPLSAAPASPPCRAVRNPHLCGLLILGVGFLLIFSYQSEIHTIVLGGGQSHAYSTLPSNEALGRKPILNLLQNSNTTRRRFGEAKGQSEIDDSPDQKRIESANNSTQDAVPSPPPPPAKKKNWKDIKNEAFKPLVENAHSNILSSRFQLVIKVLALNDHDSLFRCLTSLSQAEYAGDQVDIHIYIDHFEVSVSEWRRRLLAEEGVEDAEEGAEGVKEGAEKTVPSSSKSGKTKKTKKKRKSSKRPSRKSSDTNLEEDSLEESKSPRLPDRVPTGANLVKPSDWRLVEERLTEARRVLALVESFPWKHGKKVIHYRTTTAGSQSQWLDAWWPSSDDEFALFVEDDAELSPLFYRYARSLIATYYYQPSQFDSLLYGISLQRPQIVPGKNGRPLKVDDRTRLFKYQMVGIWGQIFFPKPWKEFREWYDSRKSHDVKPVVDGMVTTDWYKEHGEKVFTPWFVKFAYNRGYFNLYTNFLGDRVLSVTHRDIGKKTKKYAGCDSVLIWQNGTYDIDLWHMAATWHIKRYDYCFKEVRVGRFANYSSDVSSVLDSISRVNNQILMISIMGVPEVLVRNLLCIVGKVGIENYILVGEDPVLLEELARRGHATMRFENKPNLELSIEKEVSVVSQMLKLGYSVWFTRADTIWVGNPLAGANTDGADVVGLENSQLNLFFIKSTNETTRLWGSLNEELSNAPANESRIANWDSAREKFIKTCQDEGKIQMRTLDQVVFMDGEKLSVSVTLESGDSVDVILSGMRSLQDWEIKEKLRQLDLWNLDDDLVCATLTC